MLLVAYENTAVAIGVAVPPEGLICIVPPETELLTAVIVNFSEPEGTREYGKELPTRASTLTVAGFPDASRTETVPVHDDSPVQIKMTSVFQPLFTAKCARYPAFVDTGVLSIGVNYRQCCH
jgi:hypothetical protein